VKLEQLLGIVTERGRVFDQLLFDQPSQVVAGRLDDSFLEKVSGDAPSDRLDNLDAPPLDFADAEKTTPAWLGLRARREFG